jgi:hypothetical protein
MTFQTEQLRNRFHDWLHELLDSLTTRYRRRWNLRIDRLSTALVDTAFARFTRCYRLHLEAYQEQCGVLLILPFTYRIHGRQRGRGQIEVSLERIEHAEGTATYYLVAPCRLVGDYDHYQSQPRPFGQEFQTTGGDLDGVLEDVRSRRPFYVDRSPNRAEVAFFEEIISGMARAAERASRTASELAKNAPPPCANPVCLDVRDEHKKRMRRILELERSIRYLEEIVRQRDAAIRRIRMNTTPALWQRLTSEESGTHSPTSHLGRRQGDPPPNGHPPCRQPTDRRHGKAH